MKFRMGLGHVTLLGQRMTLEQGYDIFEQGTPQRGTKLTCDPLGWWFDFMTGISVGYDFTAGYHF